MGARGAMRRGGTRTLPWRDPPAPLLEQHFHPRGAVPHLQEALDRYAARSAAARQGLPGVYDLRSGTRPQPTLTAIGRRRLPARRRPQGHRRARGRAALAVNAERGLTVAIAVRHDGLDQAPQCQVPVRIAVVASSPPAGVGNRVRLTTSAWRTASTSMGGVSRERITAPSSRTRCRRRCSSWSLGGQAARPGAEGPLTCDRSGASMPLSRCTPRACHGAIARATAEGPVAQRHPGDTIAPQRREISCTSVLASTPRVSSTSPRRSMPARACPRPMPGWWRTRWCRPTCGAISPTGCCGSAGTSTASAMA